MSQPSPSPFPSRLPGAWIRTIVPHSLACQLPLTSIAGASVWGSSQALALESRSAALRTPAKIRTMTAGKNRRKRFFIFDSLIAAEQIAAECIAAAVSDAAPHTRNRTTHQPCSSTRPTGRLSRWLKLRTECVRRQIAHHFVPGMGLVLLDLGDQGAHLLEHRGRGIVIHVPLQQLQHIQAVVGVADEVSEKHVQTVVHGDEVVP